MKENNTTYIRYTLGLNGITNQTQYFYTFKFDNGGKEKKWKNKEK